MCTCLTRRLLPLAAKHIQISRRTFAATRPRPMPQNTMSEYFDNMLSWLRVPVLASSGIAVALSGLLYFKQTYAIQHMMRKAATDV
jgi:hypothetical protein